MLENAFGIVGLIAIVILTFTLWGLYHKFVHKIYFGNMLTSIVIELFICGIISFFLVSAAGAIIIVAIQGLGSVLSFIIGLIGKVLSVAIKIAIVAAIIYIIYKFVLIIKNNKSVHDSASFSNQSQNSNSSNSYENINTDSVVEPNIQNQKDDNGLRGSSHTVCPVCGTKNKSSDNYCINCGTKLDNNNKFNTVGDVSLPSND